MRVVRMWQSNLRDSPATAKSDTMVWRLYNKSAKDTQFFQSGPCAFATVCLNRAHKHAMIII